MIHLEAKRSEYEDWRVRSKLTDENFLFRDGKLSLEELIRRAAMVRTKWLQIEPLTAFRIKAVND